LPREMAYHDPNWDWHNFGWNKDVADLDRRISDDITAMSPDLRPLKSRGGKLIIYQGWDDPLNGPALAIGYRADVIQRFAEAAHDQKSAERTVDGFMRVFMVPGMGHCVGDPGPGKLDALAAVRAWVEDKTLPDRLIAVTAGFPGEDLSKRKS
jgi:feruloyl esterase